MGHDLGPEWGLGRAAGRCDDVNLAEGAAGPEPLPAAGEQGLERQVLGREDQWASLPVALTWLVLSRGTGVAKSWIRARWGQGRLDLGRWSDGAAGPEPLHRCGGVLVPSSTRPRAAGTEPSS